MVISFQGSYLYYEYDCHSKQNTSSGGNRMLLGALTINTREKPRGGGGRVRFLILLV